MEIKQNSKELESFLSRHGIKVLDHGNGVINITSSMMDCNVRDHIAEVVSMLLHLNKNLFVSGISIESNKFMTSGAIAVFSEK